VRVESFKGALLLTLVIASIVALLLVFINLGVVRAPQDHSTQSLVPKGYENISPENAKEMIDSGNEIIVLDIRTPAEYQSGHIIGALLYPLQELEEKTPDLDKSTDIIVYCGTGARSENASKILLDNGFSRVYDLVGGLDAWKKAGFQVVDNSENCQTCHQNSGAQFSQEYSVISENGKGLGCIPENIDNKKRAAKFALAELPSSYDWRDYGVMTSVKNQSSCGSCVAFGTIGAFEAVIRVEGGPPCDLSESHLFSCGGGSCANGWYESTALNYLLNYGVPDESCFPYQPYDMPCSNTCSDWQVRARKISSWSWVAQDITSIKSSLIEYGPLVTTFAIYQDFYYHYTGGVYHYDGTSPFVDYHCVVIVGYDDDQGCWICKNSWGSWWGENGYFRIGYDECKIQNTVAYITVPVRSLNLSISPAFQVRPSGSTLNYTVTVMNSGAENDNYVLTATDNENWAPTFDNNLFENVSPGEIRTTTLRVTIPENAAYGTVDNITITVISQADNTVSNSTSCIARSATVSFKMSIDPGYSGNLPGENITFTVWVKNTSDDTVFQDNYTLVASDDAGWQLLIDNLQNVLAGENVNATLTVVIPNNAMIGTKDNILITAVSRENEEVRDNGRCVAYAAILIGTARIRMASGNPPYAPFLWGVRKANVNVNLLVSKGDNLHLMFLKYDNVTVETENVIWSRTAPGAQTVVLTNLIIMNTENVSVSRVKLVLTDNAGNVIWDNMAWYTPVQDDWSNRISWIILNWAGHNSSQQDQLSNEISTIILKWGNVPSTRDQRDF
jgi:rhodanese-related sulfurtransferase